MAGIVAFEIATGTALPMSCCLTLFAAAFHLLASPAGEDVDTYRHIMFRETPFAPYRGIHPVDADTAAGVAHYAFEHDDTGRVTRISRRIGDTVIGDNGGWDSFIWFAPDVRIRYDGNREIHTYYDRHGERVAAHGNVYSARYTLDDDGRRTALAFFDAEGQPSQSEWNIHRYEWRIDEDGHVRETRFDLDGEMQPLRPDFEFFEVVLEYDAAGQIAFIRNLGLDGVPANNASGAGIDRITYDLDGNFIRWQVYDRDGRPVEGNGPNVHLGEHLYDADGNKTGFRGFDRHGNRIPFSWGDFEQRTEYDSRGNRTALRALDSGGQQDMHLVWSWSEDGTLLNEVRALDRHGETVPHAALGGAAIVRYRHGPDGGRIAEFLNADLTAYDQR